MPKTSERSFQGRLERMRSRLNWVIVRVPFDPGRVWGTRGRPRVKGEINGFPFRTSLFPTRDGGHILLINKRMQRAAKTVVGSVARFRLAPDTEERTIDVPPELKRAMEGDRALLRWFEELNYSLRKWIVEWITDVKSPAARLRRSGQIAERLLATMEAEGELPPLMQVAFARDPVARQGWEQMTRVQRRGHLLGIFYYRTPEGRARRLEKVLHEAVQVADRRSAKSR